jgi:DNA-binding NarL/FixJ family response regulator
MFTILLADDHPYLRMGLRDALQEHEGWQVAGEAQTGREAIERARELKPDLVILDLMMPELNGIEAARHIRQELPATDVLVHTFYESEELAAEAIAAGARGYVLKSDKPEDLIAAVDALSRHTPYFSRKISETVVERMVNGRPYRGGMLSLLTPREREVLQMVAEGLRTKDIASRLTISEKTVETHRSAIMRKLQLESVADVVRYAVRNNIVQP